MSWIKDIVDPKARRWEEFYRNRLQHEKVVRSTHGVNCTGSCSWNVHVKDGIVVWELQAADYPRLERSCRPTSPAAASAGSPPPGTSTARSGSSTPTCAAGSWTCGGRRRRSTATPWRPGPPWSRTRRSRRSYQQARGKGGFRRATWDEVLEIIAASTLYTVKKHGPDRVIGFSPIPAMSMLSYAAGTRFLQLLGGVNLSFYDWYCDLPNASPEIWGDQTDVAESADWYNSKYIAVMGSNLSMTRTPDVHFVAEARHDGSKMVVLSPDFSMVSKYADWWIPANAGQDGAFWMAVNHVILSEFHHEAQDPLLPRLSQALHRRPLPGRAEGRGGRPGRAGPPPRRRSARALRGGGKRPHQVPRLGRGERRRPHAPGHRRLSLAGEKRGVEPADEGRPRRFGARPRPHFLEKNDGTRQVAFTDFAADRAVRRGVPVRLRRNRGGRSSRRHRLRSADGPVRRRAGSARRRTRKATTTPKRRTPRPGRSASPASTGPPSSSSPGSGPQPPSAPKGKCSIIIGAGVNHWYHSDLAYRRRHLGADALRLRREKRRRSEPLRRPGEARPHRPLVDARWAPSTGADRRASRTPPPSTTSTATSGATSAPPTRPGSTRQRGRRPSPGGTPSTTRRGPCAGAGSPSSPVRPQPPGAGAPGAGSRGED